MARLPCKGFSIWIGPFEANAISLELESVETPRPMTHDLLAAVVGALGARVTEVVICDVRDTNFFASVELERADGEKLSLDARPSDAIALALRCKARLSVESDVISKAESHDPGSADPEKLRNWFENLSLD